MWDNNGCGVLIMKVIFCFLLLILISGNVFCQSYELLLFPEDIRLESFFLDGKIAYYIFIRKKQNIESVMLTEPTGFHALRSMEWNTVNGDERRELSGRVIYDINSRFSILSSTPIPDREFGRAFQLLIQSRVVYGNPFSSAGVVFMDINNGVQINIRTFDHKFADPNTGRFQNNKYIINDIDIYYPDHIPPAKAHPVEPSLSPDLSLLRSELKNVITNKSYIDKIDNDELKKFLREVFLEKEHGTK